MNERSSTEHATPRGKRPYLAPSVEKIALRPEEAVLGACKNNASAGPRGHNCRAVGVCSTQSS